MAGKEGFGKDMEGNMEGNGQGSSTPSLILRMGGRIVCASRHPPRPLEAWSLELGGLEEACKRLGRGLEYLVGVVLGAQIS